MSFLYGCDGTSEYIKPNCEVHTELYEKVIKLGVVWNKARIEADLNNATLWQQALAEKEISVIPNYRGEYQDPSNETEDGFGAKAEMITAQEHNIVGDVQLIKENIPFFNRLLTSTNQGLFFITGQNDAMHVILGVDASFNPRIPVGRNIRSFRKGFIDVKWSKIGVPLIYNVPAAIEAV